ncbi:MAG: hypothetical protein CM15mP65_22130 [Crocinitomicaceae bacterium]|nr:MAG: hypothetical protein CM15mP65_22130 [Crocinitomicaceae bacterium]
MLQLYLEWVEYDSTGVYSDTATNIYGCDSLTSINLTINPRLFGDTTTIVACGGYDWNGVIYDSTGIYNDTLQSAVSGCDSIITLNLTSYPDVDASFTYDDGSYCVGDANPVPTITGDTTGSFTSSTGLAIDASSGVIDIASSNVGDYLVSYIVGNSNWQTPSPKVLE